MTKPKICPLLACLVLSLVIKITDSYQDAYIGSLMENAEFNQKEFINSRDYLQDEYNCKGTYNHRWSLRKLDIDGIKEGCGEGKLSGSYLSPGFSCDKTNLDNYRENFNPDSSHRISHGFDPHPDEFPSFVQVYIDRDSPDFYGTVTCGGTIISKNVILTAGHCLQKPISSINIIAGTTSRDNIDGQGVVVSVDSACVLDDFKLVHGRPFQDIAVLVLQKPLTYNDRVKPACIDFERGHLPNVTCVTVGMGSEDNGDSFSRNLKALPMKPGMCSEIFPDQTCYVAASTKWQGNPCKGDSGGPLYCFDQCSGTTKMFVVGAVSNGPHNSCVKGRLSQVYFTDFYKLKNQLRSLIDWCMKPSNSRRFKRINFYD